jgi:hypothetical protein
MLFGSISWPSTVTGWFALLQSNTILGLALLNFFDIIDYILVGVIFLAVFAALWQDNKRPVAGALALVIGVIGIGVYSATNIALPMLSLSNQYASATAEAARASILAAGQALLLQNNQGIGFYTGFALIAVATLIISTAMLRSSVFSNATGYLGILTSALDLAFCVASAVVPASAVYFVGLALIPASGGVVVLYHAMVGWKLYKLWHLK